MESARELLRTAVRTFFPHPKQVLIIDAILLHSVLQMDDLNLLLQSQPKDIRALMNPLRNARLISTGQRAEQRVNGQRPTQREYYFCPFHPAIDAIKYKIAKLRRKVEQLYQQDENIKRKDWCCPNCKAEYEDLEILDKVNDSGFYCDRCGTTLAQTEQAARTNASDRNNHEKIRRLNDQLKKFDALILKIDRQDIPENDFQSAWALMKEVPRPKGSGRQDTANTHYMTLTRTSQTHMKKHGQQELIKSENLTINLTTSEDQEREEAERRETRKIQLAQQNQMPDWITSTYNTNNGTPTGSDRGEGGAMATNGLAMAPSDEDLEDDMDNEDDEGDFEDVEVTPLQPIAGMKREHSVAFEEDSEENEDFEDAV